jgi:hypothetical protein
MLLDKSSVFLEQKHALVRKKEAPWEGLPQAA